MSSDSSGETTTPSPAPEPLRRRDLVAIILAAGLSRRAAPDHKLLLPTPDGRPVVRATAQAFSMAGFGQLLIVVGHERARIEAALGGVPARFVFCPHYASGMGYSLASGIAAALPQARGFVISPGDLPELNPGLVGRIADRFTALDGTRHVIPVAQGKRGHPVVVGAWLRPALASLRGDTGAKTLLASETEAPKCEFLETGTSAIWNDVDVRPAQG